MCMCVCERLSACVCIVYMSACINNAVDCAVIPYSLRCIKRSLEVPLISLCLMALLLLRKILINFNSNGTLPYLELRVGSLSVTV